jgi:hypothetical protein
LVGEWCRDPELIAQEEFESALVEGWSRKKKEVRAGDGKDSVIDVDSDVNMDVS